MNRIRVAALTAFIALAVALPARAQGGGSSNSLQGQVDALRTRVTALESAVAALQSALSAETSARTAADTAMQAEIDKLNGNFTAADLEGTYSFYFVATAIDSSPNTITSYVMSGTMTLQSGGIAQFNVSASGRQLTEQAPSLNWVAANVGENQVGNASWAYSNGRVTINAGGDINDLTPSAGGQVMVGVQGGPPGNNQAILVATRQP